MVGFLLALLLFSSILLAAYVHSKYNQGGRGRYESVVIINEPKEGQPPQLCNHIVLRKDEELKKKAADLIKKEDQLEEEFDWLEMYDKGNISKMKPKTVSVREENRSHNRYIDIGNEKQM